MAEPTDGQEVAEYKKGDERFTLEYCNAHRDFYYRNCLKIATKNSGLQPFRLNYTQRVVIDTIARQRAAGIPPRLIVLKSRQVGVSTISEALVFSDALFNAHRTGLVLAHTEKAAKGLLRMTRTFYDFLPEPMRIKANLKNVHEIELDNRSRVQVEAAGEVRSYSAQSIHLSEYAFMENAKDLLIAVMQSVPFDPSSLAIIESTANGVGNKYHEMWVNAVNADAAKDASPWEKGWTPIFIPWFRHEEYRHKPWFGHSEVTSEERALAIKHKLTMNQLAWRRAAIKINCDGDIDRFKVEYPSTWQEAFALSGRPVFDADGLAHYQAMTPLIVGGEVQAAPIEGSPHVFHTSKPCEVSWDEPEKRAAFDVVEGGRLRIFKEFNPRHTYIIGADPSEGDTKSDPSPLEVLDQMTLEYVAEWWGRTPPDMLAEFAAWLGYYYGGALIIGEANNHGISFHGRLVAMNYPNIYFRSVNEETVAGDITMKPGYWETNKAKHLLFDTGRKYVREKRGAIYSPGLVGEMSTAIYDRKEGFTVTKIKPQPGHFIDRVMAALMALYAHRGDIQSPLLPLPEVEFQRAATEIMLLRERDPEGANRLSLDLLSMSESELGRVLEARDQDRIRREAMGLGMER